MSGSNGSAVVVATSVEELSHAFVPRDEPWSLCGQCGFAQAAHEATTEEYEVHGDDARGS
jgi:hypothetical protein